MDWLGLKAVAADVGLDKDALHIYAAFVIQVGAALLLKRSLSNWLPWAAVFAALTVNEYLDIFHGAETEVHSWQLWGSVHDVVNTMILPTAMLLLVRAQPFFLLPEAAAPIEEGDSVQNDEEPAPTVEGSKAP